MQPTTNSIIYADDTSLYFSSPNIDDLFAKTNRSLVNFKLWFDTNKLTLNANKTQYVIFHRRQRRIPQHENKVFLGTDSVNQVTCVKFLGILVDSHLTWKYHVGNVAKKLAKYVPIIYRIRNLCTEKSLKIMHSSLHLSTMHAKNVRYIFIA